MALNRQPAGTTATATATAIATANTTSTMTATTATAATATAGNRFNLLNYEQVLRLVSLVDTRVMIDCYGRGAPIQFPVIKLVQTVKRKLVDRGIQVRHTRLNGGAATFVIGGDALSYNDVDIIFDIDLPQSEETLEIVRQAVFCALDEFASQPNHVESKTNESNCSKSLSAASILRDACIRKLIKVYNEQDRWSLMALSNSCGKNVELKFVNKIRRPFEFTVDAFQVILDSLLRFYDNNERLPRRPLTLDYYPTVAAENVYGNYSEAHFHLQNKIIYTRDPEEIRGGGLLRYARLIVEGYRPSEKLDVRQLQEFMCSRFFIDFPTLTEQEAKLRSYLDNHFPGVENQQDKYHYLMTLSQIVAENTICLMNYDRQQTISLILCLAQSILAECQSNAYSFFQPIANCNSNLPYYKPPTPALTPSPSDCPYVFGPDNCSGSASCSGTGFGFGFGFGFGVGGGFQSASANGRQFRLGRNKTLAPRMRNRRAYASENASIAFQTATDCNLPVSVYNLCPS